MTFSIEFLIGFGFSLFLLLIVFCLLYFGSVLSGREANKDYLDLREEYYDLEAENKTLKKENANLKIVNSDYRSIIKKIK